jgi:undecaprenyl diphosphate synthase
MQSTLHERELLHVAIIMDGNGRWGAGRGLPRTAGHHEGIRAVRRVVEAAPYFGVTTLTLFAFSSDNWRRPESEVHSLMALLRQYLRTESRRLVDSGARLTVIGRRDRLQAGLNEEISNTERASALGQRLDLRIAIDYSARDSIIGAAAAWRSDAIPSRGAFGRLLGPPGNGRRIDVDLLIRTGGEKRLSDFLLWEAAYAELCFVETLWPDFGANDLRSALDDFRRRERRFGGLNSTPPLTAAE